METIKYYTITNAYDLNVRINVYENGIMKFYNIVRMDSVSDCENILRSFGYEKRCECNITGTMDVDGARDVIDNALNRGYATTDDIKSIAKSLNIEEDIFSNRLTVDNLFDNNTVTIK